MVKQSSEMGVAEFCEIAKIIDELLEYFGRHLRLVHILDRMLLH